MPVDVDISLVRSPISTFEGVEVVCTLRNTGAAPLLIPGSNDLTGALTFEVRDRAGAIVRRLSGLSRQRMMSSSRVKLDPDLEVLGPGAAWSFTLDLATYHYGFPAGDFEVEAVYTFEPAGVSARSPRRPLTVTAAPLAGVYAARDNPVIDGTALLFRTSFGATYLRQHTHRTPLAAWYSAPAVDVRPRGDVFFATAAFFRTDTFAWFSDRWVLRTEPGVIEARLFRDGKPTGERRRAPLPERGTLLRSAGRTDSEELILFFQSNGLLEAYRLGVSSLDKVFAHALPRGAGEVAVRVGEDRIHCVVPARGVLYQELALDGRLLAERRLFAGRRAPWSAEYDPVDRLVKAIFWDAPFGRTVRLAVARIEEADEDEDADEDEETVDEAPAEAEAEDEPAGEDAEDAAPTPAQAAEAEEGPPATRGTGEVRGGVAWREMTLPLRGAITELAFDRSRRGIFHLLVATTRGRLYHFADDRGPKLVASGEERFFPVVIAPSEVFLGCHEARRGYRFLKLQQHGGGPKIVDFEVGPW